MKRVKLSLLFLFLIGGAFAQVSTYTTLENIPYYSKTICESDNYINERCKLDLYIPDSIHGFPTVIWFHGGGLKAGEKEIPNAL
jgi:carboxylesterase type B